MDMKKIYTYIRLRFSELKHRIFYPKRYDKMIIAIKKYKNCPASMKKNKYQIKREIKLLKDYWGCYPLHYYRYELYKKEKELSDEELLDYIPEFFFYRLFLPKFEDKRYKFLIEEKNITDTYFRGLGIKTANTLAKVIKGSLYNSAMENEKPENFITEIKKKGIQKVFFKPVDGQGGYGIDIFSLIEDEYLTKEGIKLTEEYISNLKNDYIIQEKLEQSEKLNKIYPNSINTLRIATENINGNIRILCATLRIGRDGKEVDNSAQGGIVLGLDVNTGESKKNAITELCEKYYSHPNTNFQFGEFKIENWSETMEIIKKLARKIPYFRYLGWDIVLSSKEEIIAIETNLSFGIDHYQIPLGGLRKVFKIENPKEWWE